MVVQGVMLPMRFLVTLASGIVASAELKPVKYNAWFGLTRTTGAFMNNATNAAKAGYNTIAGHDICLTATFQGLAGGPFYNQSEMKYVESARASLSADIAASKREGKAFWASYDAMSFPTRLVEHYADEMFDYQQSKCIGYRRGKGCISFKRNRTRQVFSLMWDEVFTHFPELDGIVFRYGENSPCKYNVGNAPWDPNDAIASLSDFISTLREELCVKRNKTVIFRTWDTDTARLHSNRSFYEAVVSQVEPHANLVFSIKHTRLDFWRRTDVNPTIGVGQHPQVVEACVGNVFQGMGAYPSYIGDGVINGFEENIEKQGLRDFAMLPNFAGIFPVTQGSFNYPAVVSGGRAPCEGCESGIVPFPWVWPWLEFNVLARWANNPSQTEEEIFLRFVQSEWSLSSIDAALFRNATLLAMRGNLLAETVGVFDKSVTRGIVRPSGNFMIHNTLGGLYAIGKGGKCNAGAGAPGSNVTNACEVVPWLHDNGKYAEALQEKAEAVRIYEEVISIFGRIKTFPQDGLVQRQVLTTAKYGLILFRIIEAGFTVLLEGYASEVAVTGWNRTKLCDAAHNYDVAWSDFHQLWNSSRGACPTLFEDSVWAYGHLQKTGIGVDVHSFQSKWCNASFQAHFFV